MRTIDGEADRRWTSKWVGARCCLLGVTLAFAAVALSRDLVQQTDNTVTFEFSTRASLTLNEPVTIEMRIRNGLKEGVVVNLGGDYKRNLVFKIVDARGAVIQPPQYIPYGFVPIGKFSLAPGQDYSQAIVLNEWYTPTQPGRYQVEIALAEPLLTSDGAKVDAKTKGEVTFQVGPRNVKVLDDRCRQLAFTALHAKSQDEGVAAALALSYVNDPVAVPFLGDVLKNGAYLGAFAINGLVRIRTPQAVQILRANRNTQVPGLKEAIACGLLEIQTGTPCRTED